MDTTQRPPTRCLTHDETMCVNDKGGTTRFFRIRIWQGHDAVPVVLATVPDDYHDDNQLNPSAMSSKIANFVNQAVLHHPVNGMIYFEADPDPPGRYEQVYFEYFGCAYRLTMFNPTRVTHQWDRLEFIVGEKVEQ